MRYLGLDWIDALTSAVSQNATLADLATNHSIAVTQVVTDGPEGDVTYHFVVRDGEAAFGAGAATEEDVRRFALHSSESLKARLEDPTAPLIPMATHRQGFRQKREVVSLLRRAGYGAIAPESLSEELKGMVNRKKGALVAAGESRRRIPSTAAVQEWLDQVVEEDPLWGWVFAMVATYGLRPHEVWHIAELPDEQGMVSIGVAARHIKVTKTGFRVALPLPAEWVDRYQLGGANGEQRLEELRCRYVPKFVNEDGQPFDPERDLVKRCDNNERLGAVCCHKLRSSDAKAEFELKTKLYAWVEQRRPRARRKRRNARSAACPMTCAMPMRFVPGRQRPGTTGMWRR